MIVLHIWPETSNQIFIILVILRRSVQRVRGPSPRLSAWATHLRRNVATVASCWRHCADLTGPGIEPQTSRTDSVRLAIELTGRWPETFSYLILQHNHAIHIHSQVLPICWPLEHFADPESIEILSEGHSTSSQVPLDVVGNMLMWFPSSVGGSSVAKQNIIHQTNKPIT